MTASSRKARWTLALLVPILILLLVSIRPGIQSLEVVGQPARVGAMQAVIERPFFEQLGRASSLPIRVHYVAADGAVSDASRLAQLRSGAVDIVSMRFPEAVSIEPALAALDVVGASRDLRGARDRVATVAPGIERELGKRWNSRLMGVFPMGPQVLMCRKDIRRLSDLRGARVRVSGEAQASLVYWLAAIPARIPFLEVELALNDGLVDCAISSLASARSAGWLRSLTHVLHLPLQFSLNGYVMSTPAWERLGPEGQRALKSAFDAHLAGLWEFAERMHRMELDCHRGARACPVDTARRLAVVEPRPDDEDMLQAYARSIRSPGTRRGAISLAVLDAR